MVTLSCQPVGHKFCQNCFPGYCNNKIKEGNVSPKDLCCPMSNCGTSITIDELKANISDIAFNRYHRFMLRNFCIENNWKACPFW